MGDPVLHISQMTHAQRRKARIAGVIGNIVEWYDFALYGYLAVVIGRLFFPSENPTASLLASYGVFAAGFIMRPLGAVVFGWLGDTIGRGRTMLISVAMMAFPTILLGLLPVYDSIGLAAPVLLILVRLVQGLSVGGEFSSSVTYMVETAPDDQRGRAGSWANVGSMAGMLLGSAASALVMTLLPAEALESWGWRLPFLFGGVLGLSALLLRRNLPKSPHFQAHEAGTPSVSPFRRVWKENRTEMVQAFLFAAGYGMIFYLIMVYLPGWLSRYSGLGAAHALQINSALTLMTIPFMIFFAWLGDVWIRRIRLIAAALILLALLAWPLGIVMLTGDPIWIVAAQATLVILICVPLGLAPATFVELFPSADRLTGYSISFNLGIGVLGGATPMIATWLIEITAQPIIPVFLMVLSSAIAACALLWMQDRSREPLR
ncbi:MAG: MHS family proline/betaine transporter-like MFS transporter [Paracoccaceae bacterium]|jgi:MHS family proline/betaine transporter-like MFS transporter